jgi:hypothetical protein
MKVGSLLLALLMTPVLVLAGFVPATATDAFPVCIGLKPGGLGAPHIDFTLSAVYYGAFIHLAGEARFSQSVAPPNGLIVYSVSGTAVPNDDSSGSPSAARGTTPPRPSSTGPLPFK